MLMNKDHFTSLELVDLINQYRQQEGNRGELLHKDFLKVVRDEFEEEIGQGNISPSSYLNSQNKEQPMYILNLSQSRQVLVRESKFVRKAVIAYIDKLEKTLTQQLPKPNREEIMYMNAKSRMASTYLKLAKIENISDTYKSILVAKSAEVLAGTEILPLPKADKTYTAEEIGKMLGISANMVGRLANNHNLKTDEYGVLVHDKAKHSNKEVPSFRYYECVIPAIKSLIQ